MSTFRVPLEVLVVAAILLGALAAALIVPRVIEMLRRFVNRARARTRVSGHAPKQLLPLLIEDLCRNGVVFLRPFAKGLLRIKKANALCTRISNALESTVPVVSVRSICELELAAGIVGALIFLILTRQPLIAVIGLFIPLLFSAQRAAAWHRKRILKLREQLPDALNAIGMCFSAGHTLQQAFAQIAEETPDPLGRQLYVTARDIEVGYGVTEALDRLEKRTNCADLRFVLVALDIQHLTGGSLREILESSAASITESFELTRSLEVQTAQARLSARVVSIMPIALLVLLSLIMPGYLATFFGSVAGMVLLVVAFCFEMLGIVAIRKILGIDLE